VVGTWTVLSALSPSADSDDDTPIAGIRSDTGTERAATTLLAAPELFVAPELCVAPELPVAPELWAVAAPEPFVAPDCCPALWPGTVAAVLGVGVLPRLETRNAEPMSNSTTAATHQFDGSRHQAFWSRPLLEERIFLEEGRAEGEGKSVIYPSLNS